MPFPLAAIPIIGDIFKGIFGIIDEVHTSDEERLTIRQHMFQLQVELYTKVMDYESKIVEAQARIITAEAQSDSWIAKNWRPITMLTFLTLVVCDTFGWLPFRLASEAWTLLQIGLGGYVAGRSLEKIVPAVVGLVKNGKNNNGNGKS